MELTLHPFILTMETLNEEQLKIREYAKERNTKAMQQEPTAAQLLSEVSNV